MGRGEAARREDGWGVGDEGSSLAELDNMVRGKRHGGRMGGVLVMKEAGRVRSVVWVG